ARPRLPASAGGVPLARRGRPRPPAPPGRQGRPRVVPRQVVPPPGRGRSVAPGPAAPGGPMSLRVSLVAALTALALTLAWPAVSRGQQPLPLPGPQAAPVPVAPLVPAAPADARADLNETVGLLSGLYLYQTYLTIGLLADGKAERLYDERAARAVLA